MCIFLKNAATPRYVSHWLKLVLIKITLIGYLEMMK